MSTGPITGVNRLGFVEGDLMGRWEGAERTGQGQGQQFSHLHHVPQVLMLKVNPRHQPGVHHDHVVVRKRRGERHRVQIQRVFLWAPRNAESCLQKPTSEGARESSFGPTIIDRQVDADAQSPLEPHVEMDD